MRLAAKYQFVIKQAFSEVFGNGDIFLFGSRVNENKKGGDIDLYIVPEIKENLFNKKIKFLAKIKRELGEQKIDIVFQEDRNRLIEIEAIKWGIKL